MLSEKELMLMIDFEKNKEEYLNLVKNKSKSFPSTIEKLEKLYSEWDRKYMSWQYKINLNHAYLHLEISESKKRKIDPYIAGGIGSGIAGIAGGAYMGVSAAERNASIEENKKIAAERTIRAEGERGNVEKELYDIYKEISKILNRNTAVKAYKFANEEKIHLEYKIKEMELERNKIQSRINYEQRNPYIIAAITSFLTIITAIMFFTLELVVLGVIFIVLGILFGCSIFMLGSYKEYKQEQKEKLQKLFLEKEDVNLKINECKEKIDKLLIELKNEE